MSAAEESLRKAFGQLAAGGTAVYAPTVTTRQAQRSAGMQAQATRQAAEVFDASRFLVWYKASSGVLPDADDPAWTEVQSGTAAASLSGGLLTIENTVLGDYLFYSVGVADLDNAVGTTLEAELRVVSAASGANAGSALGIFDGAYQFIVWLRADGLNIDGEPHKAVTLSDRKHRITLKAQGGTCRVEVDGQLWQSGHCANPSAAQKVTFGSWTTAA